MLLSVYCVCVVLMSDVLSDMESYTQGHKKKLGTKTPCQRLVPSEFWNLPRRHPPPPSVGAPAVRSRLGGERLTFAHPPLPPQWPGPPGGESSGGPRRRAQRAGRETEELPDEEPGGPTGEGSPAGSRRSRRADQVLKQRWAVLNVYSTQYYTSNCATL